MPSCQLGRPKAQTSQKLGQAVGHNFCTAGEGFSEQMSGVRQQNEVETS